MNRFFLRVGLRKTLPLVAQKKFKLIRLIYVLRIARANRAVKFSSGCLQNCGLENSRGVCKNRCPRSETMRRRTEMRRPA